MAVYKSVILNERPTAQSGLPTPGRTFRTVVKEVPSEADLKDGQVLVEVYYLSIDPSMVGWMQDTPSYMPPVALGDVMRGIGAGKIVASKSLNFKIGDVVISLAAGWAEFAIINDTELFPTPPGVPMTELVSLYGGTGLTAFFGVDRIARPKEGELAVVSAAAGATGSVAGQILKLKGCKVIGIAGGQEKVKWLTEKMGFDGALDYKAPDFNEKFKEATKDGIDIYWDNTRGDILDLAFGQANLHARFVACGGISQSGRSNGEQAYKCRMQGFIVLDFAPDIPSAMQQLGAWQAEGKLWTDDTAIKGGVDVAESALIALFDGANKGKMLVEVKSPDA
ncbi:putative NADP-dependent oxidoreductase yfmJ, partial [Thozetella sp. PMI_491]